MTTDTVRNPAVDKLDAALTQMLENGQWREVLRLTALNNRLSLRNNILVWIDYNRRGLEGPISTLGRSGWMKQGRPLKKGAKAIELLKPVIRVWYEEDEDGKKVRRQRCVGFELIRKTFHIQDTVGEIPDAALPEPKMMTGSTDTDRALCQWLSRTALDDLGVTAIIRSEAGDRMLGRACGCYRFAEMDIHVRTDLPLAHAAKTLTHEIAHHMAEHGKNAHTRSTAETIAEGVAFVVMEHFGYDTSDYSIPYIGQWAGEMETVKLVLDDIDYISRTIIQKVTTRMEAR